MKDLLVARRGILKRLLKVLGPVLDRSRHEAGKDEIKLVGKVPFVLEIVDEESDVGGDAVIWRIPC